MITARSLLMNSQAFVFTCAHVCAHVHAGRARVCTFVCVCAQLCAQVHVRLRVCARVSGCPYDQTVVTGLQGVEADAEQHRRGEGVVVDEPPALGVAVATVESEVGLGVARVQHGAEVDLQRDGLNAAVHADIPLR